MTQKTYSSLTPAEIDIELQKCDDKIKEWTDVLVWFKAQRDWWRGQLTFARATKQLDYDGPATKSKAYGDAYGGRDVIVDLWWVPTKLNLQDAVRYFDAAYEVVEKRYEYYHDHQMNLMARNKNAMQSYAAGGAW